MNNVRILDCTLRDGGYINDWRFKESTIKGIVDKLSQANIDIIECGFLRPETYDKDRSVFSSINQIKDIIYPKNNNLLYVAMVEQHNFIDGLVEPKSDDSIDGIRLTFRKNEWQEAKITATKLKELGYKVFIQPVGTCTYSDDELMTLLKDVNLLNPYAFYIVDTLGIMYRNDMRRFYYLVDNNLRSDVSIGFHSHNNLQLSFSNAQEIIRLGNNRNIIVDTSVYGMGRGVGNLATELFVDYINNNIAQKYKLLPILNIADSYLMSIYSQQRWGYDLPYFISAIFKCHPNYASYLMKKETININNIETLLSLIPRDKRDEYNEKVIEKIYFDFQNCVIDDSESTLLFKEKCNDRNILLVGLGNNAKEELSRVKQFIQKYNPYIISINFIPDYLKVDAVFVSNSKRYENLIKADTINNTAIIYTSNIKNVISGGLCINYSSLLGEGLSADNSGAMAIKLLTKCGVKKIGLAGFDGFDIDPNNNFSINDFSKNYDLETVKEKNQEISKQLSNALSGVDYEFVTKTKYEF